MTKRAAQAAKAAVPEAAPPVTDEAMGDEAAIVPALVVEAPIEVMRAVHAEAPPPRLHALVSDAAHAALFAGRFSDGAALHAVETALGDVRNRVTDALLRLGPEYRDLLARIHTVV